MQFENETLEDKNHAFQTPLRFAISGENLSPKDNQSYDPIKYEAITEIIREPPQYIIVSLAKEKLLPLFRNDLNATEMLLEQFRSARAILHELGVGLPDTIILFLH